MNYLSILSKENITKSLSYEEAIKEYAAKKCRKTVLQSYLSQLINTNSMLFCWILWRLLYCQLF